MANNSNQTVQIAGALGDILGVGDYEMETVVLELTQGQGVLVRGSVLSTDASGKLALTAPTLENQAYGILLEPSVDISAAAGYSTGVVTGSVARSGSFKGERLIVASGTNVVTLTAALRQQGIYVDGIIPNA